MKIFIAKNVFQNEFLVMLLLYYYYIQILLYLLYYFDICINKMYHEILHKNIYNLYII